MSEEYSGGSVSYYTISVTHPIKETSDPYDAECIDIIDALQMTPNEANAFKALWRRAAARLGKSKRGYTDGLYDAEKVEFYGRRLVQLERRGGPAAEPETGGQNPEASIEKVTVAECPSALTNTAREALLPENQRVEPITSHSIPKPAGEGWRGSDLPGPRNMGQRVEYVSLWGDLSVGVGRDFRWNDVAWWRFEPKRCCDKYPECQCGEGADGL